MNTTKTCLIFFLVVILANPLSNSNVLASSGVEATTSTVYICYIPCSPKYGTYECFHDCLYKRYHDGNCVNGRCCCS
ncbi:putative defensin-like protein 55 [Raphanus sativus]|uniref:Defensin-like protein 55 n=1 Tax=Raphanus sativus TaxID=3726 RepID=A0A6J0NDA1_RAPSA|nr:putative defensin-like protein 55 [Raphanus sativus]